MVRYVMDNVIPNIHLQLSRIEPMGYEHILRLLLSISFASFTFLNTRKFERVSLSSTHRGTEAPEAKRQKLETSREEERIS